MKILAVRGVNLASLPKFEILFNESPLDDTRIFAITGPTGAGKSTILDAICLALYDRVPRLLNSRPIAVGDSLVTGNDSRTIMRRGTAEAFAQVDFLGIDGHVYRATWSVWRARRKLTGRIQEQKVSLSKLQGSSETLLTEGTKTETLNMIAQKVGLGFHEFQRATLLAQGDFASFLHARGDERATLLERMTGTELYAELSKEAFNRAKQEQERLKHLHNLEVLITTLDEDTRTQLQTKVQSIEASIKTNQALRLNLQTQANWYITDQTLAAEVERAKSALAKAHSEASRRPELDAQIAQLDVLARLGPLLDGVQQAEERLSTASVGHEEANQLAVTAMDELKSIKALAEKEQKQGLALKQKQALYQPMIERAKELDQQIIRTQESLQRASTQREQVEKEQQTIEHRLQQLDQELTQLRELDANYARWTAEYPALVRLHKSKRSSELIQQLHESVRLHAELELVDKKAEDLKKEAEQQRSLMTELEHQVSTAEKAIETHHESSMPPPVEPAWAEDLAHLQEIALSVRQLKNEAQHQKIRLQAQRRLKKAIQQDEKYHQKYPSETVQQRAIDEAVRSLSSLSFSALRTQFLHPETVCPLCGASPEARTLEIHQDDGTSEDSWSDQVQQNLLSIHASASITTRIKFNKEQLKQLETDQARINTQLISLKNELAQVWVRSPRLNAAGLTKVGLLLPSKLPHQIRDLQPALEALATTEAQIQATLESAKQRLDPSKEPILALQSHLEQKRAKLHVCVARLSDIDTQAKDWRERQQQLTSTLSDIHDDIDQLLFDWPDIRTSIQAPTELAEQVEIRLEEAKQRHQDQQIRQGQLETLLRHQRDWLLSSTSNQAVIQAAIQAEQQSKRHLQTAQDERLTLFDGQAVSDIESALREQQTRLLSSTTPHKLHAAETKVAKANALVQARLEAKIESQHALNQSLQPVDTLLSTFPHQEQATLRKLATEPQPDRQTLEARRSAIILEQTRAEATARDRNDRLERHRTTLPSRTYEMVQAEQRSIDSQLQAQQAQLNQHLATLESDRQAQKKREELIPKREAQTQQAHLWGELSNLIGSADGKKFRTFAQSVTLELLIAHANHHLKVLRPRYRLQKTSLVDMEFEIVDQDMGDEVRAIHSLSGGETFLVSLALALGLSDLSASKAKIESLFIDEGFGALDPESLDIALGVLDQLQATGRTIGLVSHVEDIAERIGYEVRVRPTGPGQSIIETRSP